MEFNKNKIPPIQLSWNEAIRLRPGMYVGRLNVKGFIDILKGIFSRTFKETGADLFSIQLKNAYSAKLIFGGVKRPIKNDWGKWDPVPSNPFVIEFQTLNALSELFVLKCFNEKGLETYKSVFACGEEIERGDDLAFIDCAWFEVDFELDKSIWGATFYLNAAFIMHEIKDFAYLYENIRFELNYFHKEAACRVIYQFENGLGDKIELAELNGLGGSYFKTIINKKIGNIHLEGAFAFREYTVDEPYLKSYVNDYYTHENGTHVDALLKGLTYGVMKYFQKNNFDGLYKISEKGIKEDLIAALNIRMEEPTFSGCVKNKLASPEIVEPISIYIAELLFQKMQQDGESTQKIIKKFEL